jgi:hypothetical protein
MARALQISFLLLLHLVTAALAVPDNSSWRLSFPSNLLRAQYQNLIASFRQVYPQISQGKLNIWDMVQIVALCSLLPGCWYLRTKRKEGKSMSWSSTESSSNGIIRQESVEINGKLLHKITRAGLITIEFQMLNRPILDF